MSIADFEKAEQLFKLICFLDERCYGIEFPKSGLKDFSYQKQHLVKGISLLIELGVKITAEDCALVSGDSLCDKWSHNTYASAIDIADDIINHNAFHARLHNLSLERFLALKNLRAQCSHFGPRGGQCKMRPIDWRSIEHIVSQRCVFCEDEISRFQFGIQDRCRNHQDPGYEKRNGLEV